MGQPIGHPLQNWDNFKNYRSPDLALEKRFESLDKTVKHLRSLGKYIAGGLGFGIWERLHFLRGFKEAIIDFYTHRDRIYKLLEILAEFKIGLIKGYSEIGLTV